MNRVSAFAAAAATLIGGAALAAATVTVGQKNRAFSTSHVVLNAGDAIVFTNEDPFIHQVFVRDPRFFFDSDEQEPGRTVSVPFPIAGEFTVLCGIHPKMQLAVSVR